MNSLHLLPHEYPPCHVEIDIIDEILEGQCNGDPHSKRAAATLAKRMIGLGISHYHPDPLAAIEAAEGATR